MLVTISPDPGGQRSHSRYAECVVHVLHEEQTAVPLSYSVPLESSNAMYKL